MPACNLGGLERWGWIVVGRQGDRRDGFGTHRNIKVDTVLRPTRAGSYARELWPDMVADVEARWATRFGGAAMAELRDAVDGFMAPVPWSPPEVQPSDGFRTHLIERSESQREPPLVAALGLALAGQTVRHEHGSAVSLPLGANMVRVVSHGAVVLRSKTNRTSR